MPEPTLTLEDVITRYQKEGIDDDGIYTRLKSRGIDLDTIGENAGLTKVRMTVGEFVDDAIAGQASGEAIRANMIRRGIINADNLTDEDFDRPLPAARKEITYAQAKFFEDYEKDHSEGKYDNWKWGQGAEKRNLTKELLSSSISGWEKTERWINQEKEFDAGGGDYEPLGSAYEPPPISFENDLSPDEQKVAVATYNASNAISSAILKGRFTGAMTGAITMSADLLGVSPGTTTGKALASLLTGTDNWSAKGSGIDKAVLLVETPAGEALLDRTRRKAVSNIQELAELTDNPSLADSIKIKNKPFSAFDPWNRKKGSKSFVFDTHSIEAAFGKRRGDKYTKGYLKTHGVHQKKMADQVRFAVRLEKRLATEKNFTSFSEWLNTALPDSLKIDHHNSARLARFELDKMQRSQAKKSGGATKGLTGRALSEIYEIMQSLYELTSFTVNPAGSKRLKNLEALVGAGKMSEEDAVNFAETTAFQEGANVIGSMAGYLFAYTGDDPEALENQIKAEPIQHALAALPILSLLKGAKVAGAAASLRRMQKILKKNGTPDELILKAIDQGHELANKSQRLMFRNWLDTQRGKHASSKILATMDKFAVPEITTGAFKGLLLAGVAGGEGDKAFLTGVGASLGATRGFVRNARVRRMLGDLAAQDSASGEIITSDIMASLEAIQGDESAFRVAFENELRSGNISAEMFDRIQESIRDVNESGNARSLGAILKPVFDKYDNLPPDTAAMASDLLASRMKSALSRAQARGEFPDFSGAIDMGSSLDMLARQRAAVDYSPEVIKAKEAYLSISDSLDSEGAPSGLASDAKKAARENLAAVRAQALVDFVEGSDGQGGLSYIKSGQDFNESTTAIVNDRLERKAKTEESIGEIEAKKEEKIRQAAENRTQKGMRKHVTNLEGRIKKQQEAIASNEKKLKEGEDAVQAEFDKGVANLGSDIKARQGQAAKGKKISRADDLEKAEREFRNREYGYNDAVNGVRLAQRVAPEYRGPVVKSAQKKLDTAEKMLRRADEKLDKIKADFDDPRVKRGGKNLSFAQEMKRLEKAREKGLAKLDKERNRISKHEAASAELLDSIRDIEQSVASLFEADSLKFPEGESTYKKVAGTYTKAEGAGEAFLRDVMPAEQRARIIAQEDRRIGVIRAKDALDEKRVQERLDRVTRVKAAEYRRALATAHGLHIADGDYVQRIETPTVYDPVQQRFNAVKADAFPDDDFIPMPNGYRGVAHNFDLSVGNLLTQMSAFPGEDVPQVLRLLDTFADSAVSGIDGIAKSGWAREVKEASNIKKKKAGVKSGVEDVLAQVRSDLKKEARAKAVLDDGWVSEATRALMEGRMSDRGVNDLKRIVMESYGDMIVNRGTERLLSDAGLRKRFQRFTSDLMEERIFGRDADKGAIEEFRSAVSDMANDFSQGRTMDEWSTYARVNHTFLDPEGKPYQFLGSDGRKVDASIENIFKEFIAGEIGTNDIYRARHQSFMDTVYLTARAAEGRLVADRAILEATNVTPDVWARGASDPMYQQSVYKYYLETGEMPPAFRVTEKPGTTDLVLDPLANDSAAAVLQALIGDKSINSRGASYAEVARGVSNSMRNARRRKAKSGLWSRSQDYVRLGGDLDESNIPGVTRIGSKPILDPGQGIVSRHDIVQPEHTSNIAAESGAASDIVIRREFADSIGWMLDTHSKLNSDRLSLGVFRGFNALWKWGKTAGSLLNPMTNYASNTKTFMMNQGLDPASAVLGPIKTAALWAKYRSGKLKGTAMGNRMDHLMRTGFSDQSQLVAEVDKALQNLYANGKESGFVRTAEEFIRGGKVGDKRILGVRELTELQDKLYRTFGDELFKLTDSLIEWDKIENRINRGGARKALHIRNLDTGAGFSEGQLLGSIMKLDDGYAVVMKHGDNKNKVIRVNSLEDPAAANLIAKGAMGHANSLYYNLSKSGTLIKRGKHFETIFMQPFLSWRTKAMDIPMVKKGMTHRMFVDDNYLISDSPLVNLEIYAELAERQARRAFWLSAAKDHTQDTAAIRQFLPRWARRAIITGTGAEREFFMAESSAPNSGFVTFMEFLSETNQFVSGDKGERTFWDRVNNERGGPTPTIANTLNEMVGKGSMVQVALALGGWDSLRDKPYENLDDRLSGVARTLFPGWMTRPGIVKEQVVRELEQTLNYDVEKLGKKSNHKRLKHGDLFVSTFNAMIGRKYRVTDPIWMTKLATGIPRRLVNEIIKITKEDKRTAVDPEETREKVRILKEALDSYKDHIPRMIRALKGNGFDRSELDKLTKNYKKEMTETEKAYERWRRIP